MLIRFFNKSNNILSRRKFLEQKARNRINELFQQLDEEPEENNELIPYFTESVRPKKEQVLLVKLEDVDSEEQALIILKRKVYLPNEFLPEIQNINPDKLMVGFDVIDNTLGKIGIVDFVNDQTSQKLIQQGYLYQNLESCYF